MVGGLGNGGGVSKDLQVYDREMKGRKICVCWKADRDLKSLQKEGGFCCISWYFDP